MDSGSIERLLVKAGEKITAAHVRALEIAIARQGRMSGRGVLQRRLPWGTHTSYRGGGGAGFASPIFEPSVRREGDGFAISWERGLLDGIEPTIGGVAISQREAGRAPTYTLTPAAFGESGEAKVYWRCTIGEDWFIAKVEPYVAPETPKGQPWVADKLALIVWPDGTFWRALYANQGHMAINRRVSGLAQHLFWSKH